MSLFDLRVVENRDPAAALAKFQLVLAHQVLCVKTSCRMREAQLSHRPVDVRGRDPIWWRDTTKRVQRVLTIQDWAGLS
jgi:hypothetical protein